MGREGLKRDNPCSSPGHGGDRKDMFLRQRTFIEVGFFQRIGFVPGASSSSESLSWSPTALTANTVSFRKEWTGPDLQFTGRLRFVRLRFTLDLYKRWSARGGRDGCCRRCRCERATRQILGAESKITSAIRDIHRDILTKNRHRGKSPATDFPGNFQRGVWSGGPNSAAT